MFYKKYVQITDLILIDGTSRWDAVGGAVISNGTADMPFLGTKNIVIDS